MNRADMKTRDVAQQEQIGRRASIIAERRDTRAPELERNQDLRSARRGDVGGADALLKTLGLVQDAGRDLQGYLQNKTAMQEKDNIDRGALDAARGTVDPVMMEKSLGYYNSVTKGRTVTNFAAANQQFTKDLEELINNQDDPNLEDRLAEVSKMTEEFYGNFAVDPQTGQFRDYLQSPGAMRYLAEEIQSKRPQVLAAAQTMIENKFKKEAFSHFGTNVRDQALATGTVDLVQARSLLPSIVTDEEFADQSIIAINNAVSALRDRGTPEALQQAAGLLAGLKQRSKAPINPGVGTASPTGAPAGNITATGTAGEFVSAFKSTGLSDAVVAGFLGNLKHESGFDSSRVGDSGSAFGHAQWRGPRAANFKRIIGVDPKNATPAQSVQFIKWELDNYQEAGMTKKQRDSILNAQTPEDAARAIDKFYERSDQRSTRDRMKAAREFFGTPAAAPAADGTAPVSTLKLTDPFADPITQLERSGEFVDIVGIEDVLFTPEQQARIDQLYDATTTELRKEYRARKTEQQSVNTTRLALGLSGIGGAVTTSEDIRRAFENDEIGAEDAITLTQLRERQLDRAAAEAERDETRRERESREATEAAVLARTESIVGAVALGKDTAASARSKVLKLMTDPNISTEVRLGVLGNVNSALNQYESVIANSEPVRNQQADFASKASDPTSSLKLLAPNAPDARISAAAPQYTDLVQRASARMMSDIEKGTPPEAAAAQARIWLKNQSAILVSRLTTGAGGSSPASGR